MGSKLLRRLLYLAIAVSVSLGANQAFANQQAVTARASGSPAVKLARVNTYLAKTKPLTNISTSLEDFDAGLSALVFESLVIAIGVYSLGLTLPGLAAASVSGVNSLVIGYSTYQELEKYQPKWTVGFYLAGVTAVLSGVVTTAIMPKAAQQVAQPILSGVINERMLVIEGQLANRIGIWSNQTARDKLRSLTKYGLEHLLKNAGKATYAIAKVNSMWLLKPPVRWLTWVSLSPPQLRMLIESQRSAAVRAFAH